MKSVKIYAFTLALSMLVPIVSGCSSEKSQVVDTVTESTETFDSSVLTVVDTMPTVVETDPDLPSVETAKLALDSFIEQFGKNVKNRYLNWRKNETYARSQYFWTDAEVFEVLVDSAQYLSQEEYVSYMDKAYRGFVSTYGEYTTWTSNNYNDDLMWITIATAKAYLLTGNEEYKDCCTTVFGYTFSRAWTSSYGGGMLWYEGLTTKNSCVNYPATIAACLLYKIYGDSKKIHYVDYPGDGEKKTGSYLDVAKMIYGWTNSVLRNQNTESSDYGRVYDSYDNDKISNEWSGTYNLGTCIGSATLLYELTGDAAYLEDARATFHYTAKVKYGYRTVISDECNGNDLPGFKGIMMRWINYLLTNHYEEVSDMTSEIGWVKKNIQTAWKNRNSYNIVWTAWGSKSVDGMETVAIDGGTGYNVWGCSAVVAMMATFPYDLIPLK
jgi:predicted alpha-1,6-mannanase (GH76 family)